MVRRTFFVLSEVGDFEFVPEPRLSVGVGPIT
jgi:hypothetical protein